jgi:peptide/nickel transport system permease protein
MSTTKRRGQFARAARRVVRDPVAMAGLAFLTLMVFVGAFHNQVAPYDSHKQLVVAPFAGPSWKHLLGGDDLGRDVLSRMMEGAGLSMRFSLIVVSGALLLAIPIGMVAGYLGGRVDLVLMRLMEAILSFPGLILAITIVAILGSSIRNAIVAITITLTPGFARLVRGQSLAVREETFMEASRAIGTPTRRILRRHLFPNILSPLIVQASIAFGVVLLVEAGLSFLGLGAQPPAASWGLMLRRAYDTVLVHPWHIMPPGIFIALTVLSFNSFGDGLRAALGSAPRVTKYGRLGLTTVVRPSAPDRSPEPDKLLVVDGLTLEFDNGTGPVRVVDDVSFSVAPGETLGLVGESGSGKTVTSLSIMRLLSSPPAAIRSGSVWFDGRDLLSLPFDEMAAIRGQDLAMVFQDPMAALNPSLTIQHQIAQVVRWHEDTTDAEANRRAIEALEHVGIPARRAKSYPHEYSGGMRQRAMIAMALVCRPKLLIADEPTTALDVTIQAQVLELMKDLRRELNMAMIFVTHDLGVVADICDRVAVMYAGQVVETCGVEELFASPQHPYTDGLLRSIPQRAEPKSTLFSIPGQVPQFSELGGGCRLASRCAYATDQCRSQDIPLIGVNDGHFSRCIRVGEVELVRASR